MEDSFLLAAFCTTMQAMRRQNEEIPCAYTELLLVFFHAKLALNHIDEVEGVLQDTAQMGVSNTKVGNAPDDEVRQGWTVKYDIHSDSHPYIHFVI